MKRSLIVIALAACAAAPAMAQQADYCSRSGYVEGVASDRDFDHKPCDPRAVPRVNGVPQGQPQANAQPGYNNQQAAREQQRYWNEQQRQYEQRQYEQRRYDERGYVQRNYDPRYMGNRDSRQWREHDRYYDREGRVWYGARGPEWRRGAYVPREYMARQYWVEDWRVHRLPAPPVGYHWVQVGTDYVLVQNTNGIIAQLIFGG